MLSHLDLIVDVLAGFMLVYGIFLLGRVRVRTLLRHFAAQSLLLAGIAACAGVGGKPHLFISAAMVLVLKTVFIPLFMIRIMAKSGQSERLQSILRPTPAMFLALAVAVAAFFLTYPLLAVFGANYFVVSVSSGLVLLGLLMLMTKKGLYGQIIGFLMMENGIFALGLALTGGMPLLVEVGVVFDVTVGALIMALLSYRVHGEIRRNDTEPLETLTD